MSLPCNPAPVVAKVYSLQKAMGERARPATATPMATLDTSLSLLSPDDVFLVARGVYIRLRLLLLEGNTPQTCATRHDENECDVEWSIMVVRLDLMREIMDICTLKMKYCRHMNAVNY